MDDEEKDLDEDQDNPAVSTLTLISNVHQLLIFKLEHVHRVYIYLPRVVHARIRTKRTRRGSRIYTKLLLFSHTADKLGASVVTVKKLMRLLPYKIKTGYRGIRVFGEKVTPKKGKSKKF